jgi:hypothetical protein
MIGAAMSIPDPRLKVVSSIATSAPEANWPIAGTQSLNATINKSPSGTRPVLASLNLCTVIPCYTVLKLS